MQKTLEYCKSVHAVRGADIRIVNRAWVKKKENLKSNT